MTVVRKFSLVLVFLLCWGLPFSALGKEIEIGARIGTGWNLLPQPDDPPGSPTLVSGTAFTGGSFLIGPTGTLRLFESEEITLKFSADLLYGYHRGAGFAERSDGPRIDLILVAHLLRAPLMVEVSHQATRLSPTVALGLEPVLGLGSSSTSEQRGFDAVDELQTRAKSSISLLFALGAALHLDKIIVPLDLRFSFNPFVGTSTEARFDSLDVIDEENGEYRAGTFQVAYTWQIMATTGFRFTTPLSR